MDEAYNEDLSEQVEGEIVEETVRRVTPRQRWWRRHAIPNRGMTLVEIMIVLTILSSMMVAVGVYAFDALERAKIKETGLRLNKIDAKVQEYYAFVSPSALPDSLESLVNPPGGEPAYLKEVDIKDAWGRDIVYSRTGDRDYELRSAGSDGSDGNEDDIVKSTTE